MASQNTNDKNTILPPSQSEAPSLGAPSAVIYDADALRSVGAHSSRQPDAKKSRNDMLLADNEAQLTAPDRTVLTTGGALMTQQDISALDQTDNHLLNANISGRSPPHIRNPSFEASLPARRPSDKDVNPVQQSLPASPIMEQLKSAIRADSPQQLITLAQTERIDDPEEALMLMYAAVAILSTQRVFSILMQKHQGFKTKPVWHVLFSSPSIFQVLQSSPTMAERQKFDELVLKVALERDLGFITEAVLDRAVITP